jgi:hypothetical protein
MRNIILILLSCLLYTIPLPAGDVNLAWDASISPEVTGYKIHVSNISGNYDKAFTVGNVTSYRVLNLVYGTWYFVATAYDAVGNESDYSNEVTTTLTDPNILKVSSLTAASTWFGVICLATTTTKASAIFRYKKIETGSKQYTVIATPTPIKTEHRAVLYYLSSGYFNYEWTFTDSAGVEVKGDGTFQVK